MKSKSKKKQKINIGDWIVWAIIISCGYGLILGIVKAVINYFGWVL